MRLPSSQPAPLVLISKSTGDLWRIFPDGRGRLIHDEADLLDMKLLRDMREDLGRRLPDEQGDVFQLVIYSLCSCCSGSGRETEDAWFAFFWDDPHGWRPEFVSCAAHGAQPGRGGPCGPRGAYIYDDHEHECCRCKGSGLDWTFGDDVRRGAFENVAGKEAA